MAEAVGTGEVYGICLKENAASVRVLTKCGFEPVFDGIGDYQGEKREIFKSIRKIATRTLKPATERENRLSSPGNKE